MRLYARALRLTFGALVVGVLSSVPASLEAAEYDDIPKHSLELVAKGDMAAAIDYAGASSPNSDSDAVGVIRKQAIAALAPFGSYSYHELLSEKNVGRRLVRQAYLIGYERGVLELTLTLYRPKDKWIMHGVNFSPDIEAVFAKLSTPVVSEPGASPPRSSKSSDSSSNSPSSRNTGPSSTDIGSQSK